MSPATKKATRVQWTREHANRIVVLENHGGVDAVTREFGYSDAYALQACARARRELNGHAPVTDDKHTPEERREATSVVRAYLESLSVPEDEKRVSVEVLERRQEQAMADLKASDDVIDRLRLTQKLNDLNDAIADAPDSWEEEFIRVAKWWGNWRGISYESWRELKVPARVLKEAGIKR